MKFVVLSFLLTLVLVGCSSNVTDPKVDKPNGTGLSYRPDITLYNFKGGDAYRADSTYKINFKVFDDVMGVNENVIEYKRDSEATWNLIQAKVLSSSDQLTSVNWNIPVGISGSDFKIRITTYGKIPATKQIESTSPFTIDGVLPTLTTGGLTLNSSLPVTPFTFFKNLSVSGDTDDLSGIGGYCLNSSSAAIDEDDDCWRKKSHVTSSTLTFFAGMLNSTQDVYLQLKDRAGNQRVNTDTAATDKISITQTAVTIPTSSDAFYKASSSGDTSKWLGLTIQNSSTGYGYTGFQGNSQSIDPGAIVYLPNSSILIRDRIKGIRKIDMVNMCSGEPCNSIWIGIAASGVDGAVGSIAKVVEPLRMTWSSSGVLWILDRKATASSELVIRKVDFNDASPVLSTVIGGGASTEDSIESAVDLKIDYSDNLVFYGTFQSLPNGWLIFQSSDPEAALNTVSATRYKLRIYKSTESKKIQTLYLSTKNVYDIASHSGKDLISAGSAAITFDESYQDILNIYLRVCEITLPVASVQTCANPQILGFDRTGSAQSGLQISNFAVGGNFILESPNGKDVFAKSGFSSEFKKYNFTSATWETLAGNNSWGSGYCANGVTNSACSLRLKDAFYDPNQKIIFVLDQSKIRMITPDVNKIYSVIE
tara:strand:+ start:81465 stop:83417 length:1953 start_codon:yes stop_codon:yes gene_type:complete